VIEVLTNEIEGRNWALGFDMPRLPTIVTNCIQVIIFGSTLVFILISSSTLNYSNPTFPFFSFCLLVA
jgi:hypothetical protein